MFGWKQKSGLVAAGAVLAMGLMASEAQAAPNFTVNPPDNSTIPGVYDGSPFVADAFASNFKVTTVNTGGTFTQQGNLDLTNFLDDNTALSSTIVGGQPGTGLDFAYDVYATFTATGTTTPVATPFNGFSGNYTSFNLTLHLDDNNDTDFAGNFTSTANGGTGDDSILFTASLSDGTQTFFPAGLNGSGVPAGQTIGSFNVNLFIDALSVDTAFFTSPNPFFRTFLNVGSITPNQFTLVNGNFPSGIFTVTSSGSATSNFEAPEPATLALLGTGLLGLGFIGRRRRSA